METVTSQPNGEAPPIDGFGVGPRMRLAWQETWNRLSTETFTEGRTLTEIVAPIAEIKPVSLLSLLHRMAQSGVLDVEQRPVPTSVTRTYPAKVSVAGADVAVPGLTRTTTFEAMRNRAFFRIAAR